MIKSECFCFVKSKILKRILLLTFFLFSFHVKAQIIGNLILNGSFENISNCPSWLGQIHLAEGWGNPSSAGSPDLLNACATSSNVSVPINGAGVQTARTGNSYAGFNIYGGPVPNFKEYVLAKLNSQLTANKRYCITYYVSLAEMSVYASAFHQIYFSYDSVYYPTPTFPPFVIPLTPQVTNSIVVSDTINWVRIEKVYNAIGNENFMTIGNFVPDANTVAQQIKPLKPSNNNCYYFIDDISVVEINPAKAYTTPTITTCSNTTITLGTDSTFDATYQWQPTTGLSCTNCPNPVITATANTKYVLTKQQCSATTKDSVYIQIYTPTITATAGNFKSICSNDTVTLARNDTTAFSSYQWQPPSGLSCTNCPQPVAMPFASTTYTLNRTECSFTTQDTVTIYVDDCEVKIPNIFTPNNDNANDEWKIKLPHGFKFTAAAVYDRWGTLVYGLEDALLSTQNSKLRTVIWDGRTNAGLECSAGVYFYVLHYEDKKGEVKKVNGTISLIR